jgi:hypothetical protein
MQWQWLFNFYTLTCLEVCRDINTTQICSAHRGKKANFSSYLTQHHAMKTYGGSGDIHILFSLRYPLAGKNGTHTSDSTENACYKSEQHLFCLLACYLKHIN